MHCVAQSLASLRHARLWSSARVQRRWTRRHVAQRPKTTATADQGQLPRFYVEQPLGGAAEGAMVRLAEEEARHATRTLRLREGDCLELCDGRGTVAVAQLEGVEARRGAVARLVRSAVQVPLGGWQWEAAVACGSLKGGRSDWLVEKLTELGAAALLPLRTERSPLIGSEDAAPPVPAPSSSSRGGSGGKARGQRPQQRPQQQQQQQQAVAAAAADEGEGGGGTSGGGREGRWHRVATAAMKQCLRAHRMVVLPPCGVEELCAKIADTDMAFVGVAGAPPLAQQVAAAASARGRAAAGEGIPGDAGAPPTLRGLLIVGPEGDFTPQEQVALLAAGALPAGLGPLRLRAETAAIAMLSFLRLHFDEQP